MANGYLALSPMAELARSADRERFYAALFAPGQKREALFALIAFNYEIARVREIVSEPTLGEMRFAWWHEVLNEIENSKMPRAHPVAQALCAAYCSHPFDLVLLRTLIDARSFDLYSEPMPNLPALELYARATGGNLHRAMAQVLNATSSEFDAAHACGTAWALTGLVRAVGIHAARHQLYLPLNELQAQGIGPDIIFAGARTAGLKAANGVVIARAKALLAEAREARPGLALPALLVGALLPAQWRHIVRKDYDPFRFATEPTQFASMARLLIAAIRGRI